MFNDLQEILLSEDDLAQRVKYLGRKISEDYEGKELLIVVILKGGFIFASDLMRAITIPVQIDFMAVSSYGTGSESSGVVKILKDLNQSIEGKHVLIVEDILDSGNTLSHLVKLLQTRNPADVKICTILNKPERRVAEIDVDYLGFDIPDEFVVGYGLDYAEKYRNLPYVAILKREIYEND